MGQMRFLVPFAEQLPEEAVERAYLAGMEGIPWRSRNSWTVPNSQFVIDRGTSDSGNLFVPWKLPGGGEVCLSTASLMERPEPYHLPLELARGTLNRLRNQAADWQTMGLAIPTEFLEEMRKITAIFAQAATSGTDVQRAAKLAADSISLSIPAMQRLAAIFAEQALAARQTNTPTLPTFLTVRLDCRKLTEVENRELVSAFNSAMVTLNWRDVEASAGKFTWDAYDQHFDMCRDQGLRVLSGPLLQLDKHHTPDWLYLWEDDFAQVQASVVQYVAAVVERFRGKVHVWNCAARMNLDGSIQLDEEQRLRLVVAVIDEVQRLDPRTPYIITFDQPWAEYLATAENDFSPLHFADSLVRAELGLAGIGLEMNFDYWPAGSQRRDLLEISRLLDRWNMLGLPLLVFQSLPSSNRADERARIPTSRFLRTGDAGLSPESQRAFAEGVFRLVLGKSFLHGYVWQDVSDAAPHEFAHGGLFDARSQPKPILKMFKDLRKSFLT